MNISLATYWRGVANGTRCGILGQLLKMSLVPFSLIYAFLQSLRAWLYHCGILSVRPLPRPVVSIGNITVGGTGKTPVTAHIASLLLAQGLKVVVLSRGYGGTCEGTTAIVSDGSKLLLTPEECGDEPYLLASTIPGLIVVIGTDRHAAGMLAMKSLSPDIFLLDDGFQHIRQHRDLNILLLDFNRPFGNGWCLPAGLLREPECAVTRADLIISTRCPRGGVPALLMPATLSCTARHELIDAVSLAHGEVHSFESLNDKKLMAFAGIADPDSFVMGLNARGLNVVATLELPDHTVYSEAIVTRVKNALLESGADFAITTEKDGVKLKHLQDHISCRILLARLKVVIDDPAPLMSLLRNLLQK